jgi:hypothetical protein
MSQHTIIEINPPHNGKPINKIAISPQLRYVVTYSQEDKSFVGWRSKCSKETRRKNSFTEYIKNNINPFIGLLISSKDSQEDESNDDDDDDSEPFSVDDNVQPYNLDFDISDYKVSDEKIIMYEDNNELGNYSSNYKYDRNLISFILLIRNIFIFFSNYL